MYNKFNEMFYFQTGEVKYLSASLITFWPSSSQCYRWLNKTERLGSVTSCLEIVHINMKRLGIIDTMSLPKQINYLEIEQMKTQSTHEHKKSQSTYTFW